jgi:dienelactone hydrolase
VAGHLQQAGLATCLFDLLTRQEEAEDAHSGHLRFDIGLLAERLMAVTSWLREQTAYASLNIGYFGSSTGGGAAIVAAAAKPDWVRAIVSRGGRPDLAGPSLPRLRAPTMLIVGGHDSAVIDLNQQAQQQMQCLNRLEIVPKATHLFEEPGALEKVSSLAADWFNTHL